MTRWNGGGGGGGHEQAFVLIYRVLNSHFVVLRIEVLSIASSIVYASFKNVPTLQCLAVVRFVSRMLVFLNTQAARKG